MIHGTATAVNKMPEIWETWYIAAGARGCCMCHAAPVVLFSCVGLRIACVDAAAPSQVYASVGLSKGYGDLKQALKGSKSPFLS